MSYPKHTPFFHKHCQHGAEFVDRFGFAAPYAFQGTEAEHQTTREAVGIFDVYSQYMIDLRGSGAYSLVQHVAVNDLGKIGAGGVQYTSLCNDQGGIIDDLTVFRLAEDHIRLCPTPSRVGTVEAWLHQQNQGFGAQIINLGNKLAYLSVQGPNSRALLSQLTDRDLGSDALRYFRFCFADVADVAHTMISRTGCSGELGYELFFPSEYAEHMWDRIFSAGHDLGVAPCGLGALVSLRLEKKYPLYGVDLTEDTSPIEAGLGWTVAASKTGFIGKDALLGQMASGPTRQLVQLVSEDRTLEFGVGANIFHGDTIVGTVSSAGVGWTVGRALALGYVSNSIANEASGCQIETPNGARIPVALSKSAIYDPERLRVTA